jgi:hypothetical protein
MDFSNENLKIKTIEKIPKKIKMIKSKIIEI